MKAAIALALVLIPGVVAAADTPLTPAQALDRRTIGEIELSPDGRQLVFTVTSPAAGTKRPRAVWLCDVAAGEARPLTFSRGSDYSPRWSSDGASIAFLSTRDVTRDDEAQLFVLPMQGGEAARLVDRTDGVRAFRWSPDGRRIALLMPEPRDEAAQARQRDRDDSHVADRGDRRPRVWLLDVATRDLRRVTDARWEIRQIEWLSNSELVTVATASPASDQWTDRIYTVPVDGSSAGTFVEIAAPRGPVGQLAVSPDGGSIAYVGARVDGPEAHDLYVQAARKEPPRNLTAGTLDRPIAQPRWIDPRTIGVTVARGFKTVLATITLDGQAATEDTDVNPSAFARRSDGTVAFAGETAARAPELYVRPANGQTRKATAVNAQWASIPVTAPEFLHYKSGDGVDVEAALLRPSGGSGAAPLVVLVHGGPTGRWSDAFEPWGQLLAARGYAVLYPNVRGSTGYGEKFVEMNRADWGGGDFRDVMAGVDAMIARGVADPERLGIGGWSYGGYMAAWAVTQTNRFKASVSGAPVIDLASEFGTEDGSAYDEWFYGTPYEKLDGFVRSSPITYVKRVKTPTLLLQGEDDPVDPIGQSQQFYRGLKRYGVETELVLYPREPHGFREEKHLLDRLNRIVAWYDKYLKRQAPSTQP